jgi:hypothetical protein
MYLKGLISKNIPPLKKEGYYANSSKVGWKLCLIVGTRSLPLLRCGFKDPPPCDPPMFRFMETFAYGCGTFSKWRLNSFITMS